ncbi:D-alanyl-D-alanine carboxypeptidase [Bdellovibrio svalbardensis]|uniref:D-alanyl-D-alanine carboxypeptidase n=1 Tax=Bdellovibrio svalbardensis TaxID=2972972 RepID=A0ABT6DJN5_9BACT|nr:D-alanyl-D-alanine carboxypeptidase [Bdellovibrio svalbardensis]MDG0815298.1 D-alanyl-D-alanine carboxypeptidase [Bdellovibrio svalbardensis]
MISRKLVNAASLTLGLSLMASSAMAKVEMNAMCFMKQSDTAAQAFNPTKEEIADDSVLKKNPTNVTDKDVETKFRIASLSKVLTTQWAIAKLGPEYRFKTKIHVTPGSKTANCNIHIEGDMDPYMGRDMLTRIFTQLKPKLQAQNCKFIETFSYDQFFPVYLDVMKHQKDHAAGWEDPARYFNSTKTKNDLTAFIKLKSGLRGNFDNIGVVTKDRYSVYLKTVPSKTFSVKSRPLHMILKDLNKYSFNYPPNVIFEKLGGAEGYKKFVADRMKLSANDIEMYNGSGYPAIIDGVKLYNLVSCSALVHIMQDLDKTIEAYKGSRPFQMADVMAVGGSGESYSTFKGLYGSSTYDNTLVAKTGSADKAITFGGMLSTKDGDLFFAVLTSPDNYGGADTTNARVLIRSLVQTLAERQKLTKFSYKQLGDMNPTDDQSTLVEEQTSKVSTSLK